MIKSILAALAVIMSLTSISVEANAGSFRWFIRDYDVRGGGGLQVSPDIYSTLGTCHNALGTIINRATAETDGYSTSFEASPGLAGYSLHYVFGLRGWCADVSGNNPITNCQVLPNGEVVCTF